MSVKHRFAVRPHVMLNACLALSWSDKSFRPRSRVAQFRIAPVSECVHTGGSKDVWIANGVSPRAGSTPDLPSRLVESLRARRRSDPRSWFLSCTKGDPMRPQWEKYGFVLGIIPQLGRNRFESPSLLDSENLTEQRQRRVT